MAASSQPGDSVNGGQPLRLRRSDIHRRLHSSSPALFANRRGLQGAAVSARLRPRFNPDQTARIGASRGLCPSNTSVRPGRPAGEGPMGKSAGVNGMTQQAPCRSKLPSRSCSRSAFPRPDPRSSGSSNNQAGSPGCAMIRGQQKATRLFAPPRQGRTGAACLRFVKTGIPLRYPNHHAGAWPRNHDLIGLP